MASTRGPLTLIAAGIAGLLIWAAGRTGNGSTGGYWAVVGILAGAGLALALPQLVGGGRGRGRPTISAAMLVFAFLPTLVAVAWVVVAGEPHGNIARSHVLGWSSDIGVGGAVGDLIAHVGVLAFGLGLVFGFTLDRGAPQGAPAPSPELGDWREVTTVWPVSPSPDVDADAPTTLTLPRRQAVPR